VAAVVSSGMPEVARVFGVSIDEAEALAAESWSLDWTVPVDSC
jgi:hypothetical protein